MGGVLGKDQGLRVLFHYSIDADLPPTQRPSAENNPRFTFFPALLLAAGGSCRGDFTEGKVRRRCSDVGSGESRVSGSRAPDWSRCGPYLADLLAQHGGAGVDDKHHVLGDHRQVLGSEVVDKVPV